MKKKNRYRKGQVTTNWNYEHHTFNKRKRYKKPHPKNKLLTPLRYTLWREADGIVRQLILTHPEYFTRGRIADFHMSAVKRLCGAMENFAKRQELR